MKIKNPVTLLRLLDKRISKLNSAKDRIIDECKLCKHCYKKTDRDVNECSNCHNAFSVL